MGENAQGGVLSKMLKGEFIPGGRKSFLFAGEKHCIQGGENAGGEKVSEGRKCVSRNFGLHLNSIWY